MSNQDKLKRLKDKKEQLDAQIKAIEAREATKRRKEDTRRKILVGAYYMDKAVKENSLDEIAKLMDGYLERSSDRVLFELPPLDDKTTNSELS